MHLPHSMSFSVALVVLMVVIVVNLVSIIHVWRVVPSSKLPTLSLAQVMGMSFSAFAPLMIFITYDLQVKHTTPSVWAWIEVGMVTVTYISQTSSMFLRRRLAVDRWVSYSIASSITAILSAAMCVFF